MDDHECHTNRILTLAYDRGVPRLIASVDIARQALEEGDIRVAGLAFMDLREGGDTLADAMVHVHARRLAPEAQDPLGMQRTAINEISAIEEARERFHAKLEARGVTVLDEDEL